MSRHNNWNRSWFARKLRHLCGRPSARESGTFDEWTEWERREKAEAPVLYWLLETVLPRLQRATYFHQELADNIRWRIRNRFFLRIYALPTLAKIDQWMDLDDRILYGCFNALVNFVEIELAEMQHICNPGWFADNGLRYSRWPWWRCQNAGVAYLEHQVTREHGDEDFTERQARKAQEILNLFYWWTEIRPVRPDAMDASGLGAIFDASIASGVDFLSEKFEKTPGYWDCSKKNSEIEDQYESEDTEMLVRLMKIRGECWT